MSHRPVFPGLVTNVGKVTLPPKPTNKVAVRTDSPKSNPHTSQRSYAPIPNSHSQVAQVESQKQMSPPPPRASPTIRYDDQKSSQSVAIHGSSYTRTPAKKRVAELEPVEDLRNTTKPRHHQEKVAQGENVQYKLQEVLRPSSNGNRGISSPPASQYKTSAAESSGHRDQIFTTESFDLDEFEDTGGVDDEVFAQIEDPTLSVMDNRIEEKHSHQEQYYEGQEQLSCQEGHYEQEAHQAYQSSQVHRNVVAEVTEESIAPRSEASTVEEEITATVKGGDVTGTGKSLTKEEIAEQVVNDVIHCKALVGPMLDLAESICKNLDKMRKLP